MIAQLATVANQLTLLRLVFIPFVIINVVEGNYFWALGLFVAAGISDGLDGLLARKLKQQTLLGEYLDPIADKMLLSSMFLVLSFEDLIPWKYTVIVFSRDVMILVISALLFMIFGLRDFRPSIFGKANTLAQIATVFLVLVFQIWRNHAIYNMRTLGLWLTFTFTIVSAMHYVILVEQRLRAHNAQRNHGSAGV